MEREHTATSAAELVRRALHSEGYVCISKLRQERLLYIVRALKAMLTVNRLMLKDNDAYTLLGRMMQLSGFADTSPEKIEIAWQVVC